MGVSSIKWQNIFRIYLEILIEVNLNFWNVVYCKHIPCMTRVQTGQNIVLDGPIDPNLALIRNFTTAIISICLRLKSK